MHCIQSFLKKDEDGIQSIVNRAVISLPRKKHIKFISQTALLEFKSGVPDRGRSMLESILREYPKRTDLWSIYLDQVIKHNKTSTCFPFYFSEIKLLMDYLFFCRRFVWVMQK